MDDPRPYVNPVHGKPQSAPPLPLKPQFVGYEVGADDHVALSVEYIGYG
ncbi:hypothetical protein ACFQ0X_25615 [Streptomyces rectiviolaceus]